MSGGTNRLLLGLVALVAVAVTVFPLLWMLKIALNSQVDALAIPPNWLAPLSLDAFHKAVSARSFAVSLANSVIVAFIALAASLALGLLAAYAFSRYRFPGAQVLLFALLCTRIFPPIAMVVPFFLNLDWMGLRDTHIGLALAYIAMDTPLAIWMLKGYYDAIPTELEESALIDGASRFQAVTKVTLPLMAPGIVATGIFVFILSWNEFLFALILTSTEARTLPVVIAEFIGETGIDWPEIMAASTMALLPVLVLTFIMQKHIASGLTGGAVKG